MLFITFFLFKLFNKPKKKKRVWVLLTSRAKLGLYEKILEHIDIDYKTKSYFFFFFQSYP